MQRQGPWDLGHLPSRMLVLVSFLDFAFAFRASKFLMTETFTSRRTELRIPLVPFVFNLVDGSSMTELFRHDSEIPYSK